MILAEIRLKSRKGRKREGKRKDGRVEEEMDKVTGKKQGVEEEQGERGGKSGTEGVG